MLFLGYLFGTIITAEILSYFNAFNLLTIRILNLIFLAFYVVYLSINQKLKVYTFLYRRNIFFLLTLLLAAGTSGLMIVQNVWDSMTYHLPRYLHWFQNENIDFYFTSNQRQNVSPILPDLLFANIFSIFSSDRFTFIVTLTCILVASFYAYKITFLLTNSLLISNLALFLSLIFSSHVAFMSSTQTDPVSTALVLILLYYVLLSKDILVKNSLYALIILIPLFLTAKTTGLIFAIPLYCIFIIIHRKYIYQNIIKLSGLLFVAVLTAVPYLLRVARSGVEDGGGVFVTTFSISGFVANFVRIFASNIQTPISFINSFIEDSVYRFFHLIKIVLNPPGYGVYGDFYLSSSLHGDLTGNPLHVILIVVASIWAFKMKQYRWIPLLLLTQLGLLALLIGWQPWINRFTSTLLVIGSILIALWFSTLKKIYVNILLSILIIYSSFWVFFNPSRSLLDPKPLVAVAEIFGMSSSDLSKIRWDLVLPKEEQYFSVRPEIQGSYLGAIEKLNLNSSNTIFLKIGGDDYEYPIWALTNFGKKIYHFDGSESQLKELEEKGSYLFCTVECSDLGLRQEYSSEFVTLWSKG